MKGCLFRARWRIDNVRKWQRLLLRRFIYVHRESTPDSFRCKVAMQTERHTDLSINLSTFFLKNTGLWIAEDSAEERWMKMMLFFTIFTSMMSAVIIFRDLYFTILYKGVSIAQLNNEIPLRVVSSHVIVNILNI